MQLTLDARKVLRQQLLSALQAAALSGKDDDSLLRWLATDLAPEGSRSLPDDQALFRDTTGTVRTLAEVEAQEDDLGVLLIGQAEHPVVHALTAQGRFVLPDTPAIRSVFAAFPRKRALAFLPRLRTLRTATERFFLPQRIADTDLSLTDRTLVTELQRIALNHGFRHLHFGRFGGIAAARHEPAVIPLPSEQGVVLRNLDTPIDDQVLINHGHPTIRAHRLLARVAPTAAVLAILQLVLTTRGASQEEQARLCEAVAGG